MDEIRENKSMNKIIAKGANGKYFWKNVEETKDDFYKSIQKANEVRFNLHK